MIKNLIYKGGGVIGAAYSGSNIKLDELGIWSNIERFAGTSAGAITAGLASLDYSPQEIKWIVENDLDFASFKDESWLLPINVSRVITDYGWYKGEEFLKWIRKKVAQKTGSEKTTFAQLAKNSNFRYLAVTATNLSKRESVIFSSEMNNDVPVAEAIRMSMSIPLFFAAVKWKGNIIVDGGYLYNYPIDLFDQKKYISDISNWHETQRGEEIKCYNNETIGLWLGNRFDNSYEKITGLKDYLISLSETGFQAINNAHIDDYDWKNRTITIPNMGVKATDFDTVKDKLQILYKSGYNSIEQFFQKQKVTS